MDTNLYYSTHDSAIGTLLLVASARGLSYVTLLGADTKPETRIAEKFKDRTVTQLDGFFTTTKTAIDSFLKGDGPLKLPVDLIGGTALQRSVWLQIARIPYGQTISYTTLAEKVGFPRAVRAVASACGANPVPLAIPCHRVLSKDGTLGGFSLGGIEVKDILLKAESTPSSAAA